MIFPSASLTSFKTAFNLSSNSPLYFAPAIKLPISARPSMIAVFPTPGSPINTGLFFVLLDKTLTILLISSSLPITGSNFPLEA
eukprot:gene2386-gene2894